MPLRIVAVLVLVLALAPTARAQHPLPQGSRPLHVRLAAADVVAVGTIGAITEGRVEIRDATVLRGDAAASFEIKRSPAKALQFATGVPAVLLLRGARSPYVLVDDTGYWSYQKRGDLVGALYELLSSSSGAMRQ